MLFPSIRNLREKAGLKQSELAKAAGITQAYLSEIESGKKSLSKDAAEKICNAFSWLIGGDESEVKFNPEAIKRKHIVSFYPQGKQQAIMEIMTEIEHKKGLIRELLGEAIEEEESNKYNNIEAAIKENQEEIRRRAKQLELQRSLPFK